MPERVRHVKRGTEYEVLARGVRLQGDAHEPETLVFYHGSDGQLWAREESEFDDGRFEALASAPPAPSTAEGEISGAARDVLAERRRQVEAEGWTPEHDDLHRLGEMAWAAAAYAESASRRHPTPTPPATWPWRRDEWKPGDPRRNLIKAGALILAEIERLDRAAARAAPASGDFPAVTAGMVGGEAQS